MIGYEKEEYENNLTSVEHIQSGKLYWMILDADYMEYLKRIDPHIPDHDYGPDHIKPFYGPLIRKDGICYVAGVSHYIPDKHDKIPANLTFQKLYDHEFQ